MPEVRAILALLDRDGEQARVVGGAVRNALLGLAPGDIDIATTALPEEVTRRARAAGIRAVPTGIEHGTVTLVIAHHPFEVTTLREDVETDGRRAVVAFGRDFSHDARRRDFTMNALYARADGTVEDHIGGLADIEARRVRFIGDPETRIREDYLRILRLFRFHSHYGHGEIDRPALTAAVRLRAGLSRLSAERIRNELLKLLVTRRAAETLALVAGSGFLDRILAGVGDAAALAALAPHEAAHDPILRLAAVAVRTREDAERLHARLRLSNAEGARLALVARLLEHLHERFDGLDRARLRELAFRHGAQPVRDALTVEAARRRALPWPAALAEAAGALDEPLPASPFSGAAVMALGVPRGPRVGAVLERARTLWIAAGFPADPEAHRALLARALAEA
ncbi:CCA tRNA nucleotidyltransferase [Alsobacter sp. SYSU M60028]|uniref:CCA tRNA nucleotidyltransferase n=1 Tax=Alsobacter ponti TaxID=2962936 RepID=A0ABT1L7F0_9HYPH|nr:CCA tRNA nucleotidyltransferase [Alsobacter ponti]MCP8937001.1 CCA tRNA nucleotidyltransferase [Alsobacter ponti]